MTDEEFLEGLHAFDALPLEEKQRRLAAAGHFEAARVAGTIAEAQRAEPVLHRCAGPSCPGYPYRASDTPHPASCNVPFELTQLDQAIQLLERLMQALRDERDHGEPVRRSIRVRHAMREAAAWLEGEDADSVPG